MFNEKDNGILSEDFQDFNLNNDDYGGEDETTNENEHNMQEEIQDLDHENLKTKAHTKGSQGPDYKNKEVELKEQEWNVAVQQILRTTLKALKLYARNQIHLLR